MTESHGEPVEVSTRMRPGEWTPESLEALTASYQENIRQMGAPEADILTEVETPEDGSASVRVSWLHQGVHTYADFAQTVVPEDPNARGDNEHIPLGEATEDSKGLGAVLGDAERSAIDGPPTARAEAARTSANMPQAVIYTSPEGKTYMEEIPEEPVP